MLTTQKKKKLLCIYFMVGITIFVFYKKTRIKLLKKLGKSNFENIN
ncbi:MAG: hypothetical protein ACI9TK_001497 [Flavobacteriaceae bacterium]|jgi:hypothetical protein